MLSVGMYVGGMVEFFEDRPRRFFDIKAFSEQNFIFSSTARNTDYVSLLFFGVTETAGGLFFRILNYRANVGFMLIE
jgi:hypothetical protein